MGKGADQNSSCSEEEAEQIASLREEMVRFAVLQLRDIGLAEDTVHEAINAALSSGKLEGRSSLKSWVYRILRNKIIDVFRERSRYPTESYIENDCSDVDSSLMKRFFGKKSIDLLAGISQKMY